VLALVTLAGLLGLVVGSFLNVVILRVPAGESLVRPPSRCRGCGTAVSPRDNVPVVSWLLLRGRARCCGTRISARYPAIEVTTGVGFGAVTAWVLQRAGTPAWPLGGHHLASVPGLLALLAMLYLAAVSIALGLIDIAVRRLPAAIVILSWWVAAVLLCGAALLAGNPAAAVRAVVGGLVLWLVYRVLHAVYPAGMGYGDVRLAGLLGGYLAWIGWDALAVGAFLAFLTGGVVGVGLVLVGRLGMKSGLPYGPYMLVGAWLGLLAGPYLAERYLVATGIG
jgi:leader peptidase (prepilin peptidase) / N-methyltransferase